MKLDVQKRIAASVLKCSPKRVVFDGTKLKEIKEAITKADMRGLIIDGFVWKINKKGISNFRANQTRRQKKKGKRKGHGSRKGSKNSRTPRKRTWINAVRLQRGFIKNLKNKKAIDNNTYWDLYYKIKGGFFRSKRHLQIYLAEKKSGAAELKEAKKEIKAAKPEEKSKETKAPKKEKPAKKEAKAKK